MSDSPVLLRGGVVLDGTGAPRLQADVRLEGGRIAAVGPDLPVDGAQVEDVGGLCVAPGFVDAHSHSDLRLFHDACLIMKAAQGITTEVLGQDGLGPAPLRDEHVDLVRTSLSGLAGSWEAPWNWRDTAGFLAAIDAARPAQRFAWLLPHGAVRRLVVGDDDRAATDAELAAMATVVERELAAGACGLSTGLIYPPCCFGDTDELVALATPAGAVGKPIVAHLRSESDAVVAAAAEWLEVGRRSGAPTHFSHIKIAGRDNWGDAALFTAMLDDAKAEGRTITADQYPYAAGSTMFAAILPPWAHSGGADAVLARLADAGDRQRMRDWITGEHKAGWDNFWDWTGPEGIAIADLGSGDKAIIGLRVDQAARQAGSASALDFAFDLLLRERLAVAMVSHSQSPDLVEQFWERPDVCGCTDALLGAKPHPRAYGSFPLILGRAARGESAVSLEQAVRKLTSLPCAIYGLPGGRVAADQPADLAIFDPASIDGPATFEDPCQLPIGMHSVWVGGEAIVRGNAATGARPGGAVAVR